MRAQNMNRSQHFQHSNLLIASPLTEITTAKTIHAKEESLADWMNAHPLQAPCPAQARGGI